MSNETITGELQELEYQYVECRFNVERTEQVGNIGESKSVTFEGYVTPELYATIADAIMEVVK
jgi:hypothetical protein